MNSNKEHHEPESSPLYLLPAFLHLSLLHVSTRRTLKPVLEVALKRQTRRVAVLNLWQDVPVDRPTHANLHAYNDTPSRAYCPRPRTRPTLFPKQPKQYVYLC